METKDQTRLQDPAGSPCLPRYIVGTSQGPTKTAIDPTLKNITLRQFWSMFARDRADALAYSTRQTYHSVLKMLPALLDIPISQLTPANILAAIQSMPQSDRSKNHALQVLRTVLRHAQKFYKIIPSNPACEVQKIQRKEKNPMRAFSRIELKQLLTAMEDLGAGVYLLCLIAATTGMRQGEILGLTWSDISFANCTIRINKQWNRIAYRKKGARLVRQKIVIGPSLQAHSCYAHYVSGRSSPFPLTAEFLVWSQRRTCLPKSGIIFGSIILADHSTAFGTLCNLTTAKNWRY